MTTTTQQKTSATLASPSLSQLPVEMLPQLMTALQGAGGPLQNLNPITEVEALAYEPRYGLLPMMVNGVIDRKKTRIQTANLKAKRGLMQEHTGFVRDAIEQVKAKDELADALLKSGSLTGLQRMVLSMQFPHLAKRVLQQDELSDLTHEVSVKEKRLKLQQLNEGLKPKDPRGEYEDELNRHREEAVLGVQHGMATAVQLVQLARQIEQQLSQGQFEDDERQWLADQLSKFLGQHHVDTHRSQDAEVTG